MTSRNYPIKIRLRTTIQVFTLRAEGTLTLRHAKENYVTVQYNLLKATSYGATWCAD